MRFPMLVVAALVIAGSSQAQPPGIAAILERVAVNQARSQELRERYVFTQNQLLRMHRGNGRLAREERREYSVTPKGANVEKKLAHFEGKYETHGAFIGYQEPRFQYKELDIDGELMDEMSNEMLADDESRDGIDHELFPLTASEQAKYDFKLVKTEEYRGRPVYRISFVPRKGKSENGDSGKWRGEVLIDAAEFQPVSVVTHMASRIPVAARLFLGTNLKGLGFSVAYEKFEDGVWFPVSYGGEFEVRVLFAYKRTIAISMKNSGFRRTNVTSSVQYQGDAK